MTTPFPRARHIELAFATGSAADSAEASDALGRAQGAQAVLIDAAKLPAPAAAAAPGKAALPAGKPAPGAPVPSATLATSATALPRAGEIEVWHARDGAEICLDEDGERAGGAEPLLCPNAPRGRLDLQRAAAEAASRTDAIVFSGIDRWYAKGPHQAGFCLHCERALVAALRQSYGDQLQPFAPFTPVAAAPAVHVPLGERPFAGMRQALLLSEPLASLRASVLAARDAARKSRGAEISVLARAGALSALSLLAARHLDGLIFALPSTDPYDALLPLLCARAAMGERAAIAELPATARPDEVRLLAALATACDADVLLAPGASAEAQAALAAHRQFAALLRERYRPAAPLSEIDVIIAPRADHFSGGSHLRISRAAVAALARAQLQLGVRLDAPSAGRDGARLLLLAGAESLPDALAPALRRHVEGGGDLLLVGRCERIDDEGRPLGPLFPEAKPGLERVGDGRVLTVGSPPENASATDWTQLDGALQRALKELLARAPRTLALSGRGQLWTRAYLDPERKLDVHLVNLDRREGGFVPAQGVLLQIAGAAAGAGRTGFWFAHERGGKEGERIALNPSGFSVSTVLPAVNVSALLSVPR